MNRSDKISQGSNVSGAAYLLSPLSVFTSVMAAQTARLPAVPAYTGTASSLRHSPTKLLQAPSRGVSFRRMSRLLASLEGKDGGNVAGAIAINGIFHQSSPTDVIPSQGPLPKPLTASSLSSPSNGSRLRVAYQGVPGAYSEAAASKAYPNCEAVPCDQFETAFDAVERWLVDRAVLPIENSLGGSIHRNYDLLLRHKLHIVGEVQYGVRHCLLANHGVKLEDLRRVLSHPQALAQCENTLTRLDVVREAVDDTAGAAQYVATHKFRDAGAVASSRAAEIYDLNVLLRDIQDDSENVTRFLMLAREPVIPGVDRPFKTSVVFSLEEGPGALFKALAVFATRNINLTKIESRPQRKKPLRISGGDGCSGSQKYFHYLFYVDFEASMASENAQNALRNLKEFAVFLRVLGSYPMDTAQL